MTGRDDRHLSMRARNATTRLTEYTATRVRYKTVTYERVLTLFVPARVFTGARSSSHASPLGPARHSPGDSLFLCARPFRGCTYYPVQTVILGLEHKLIQLDDIRFEFIPSDVLAPDHFVPYF